MMSHSKKIIIICSRLDLPGGIERAVVNTANLFHSKGHLVTILILDDTSNVIYNINDGIRIEYRKASFGITRSGNIVTRKLTLLSDVLRLRKLLNILEPDIIITTEYPITVATILTGAYKKCTVFSWEHHHFNWVGKNQFWKKLTDLAYRKLTSIICLNKTEASFYNSYPTVIIPNFVEPIQSVPLSRSSTILTIGWLIPRKGIDLLLKIASKVLSENKGWIWKLIGKGEMEEEVLEFIKKDPAGNRLILQEPGLTPVEKEYRDASIFALTSRFEAFPMVLLEAMAHGLPCVSFDCPTGPSDIILSDENGLLVEAGNTESFSRALSTLIKDEIKRKQMQKAAVESINRFSPSRVYDMWENLFLSRT